MVDFKMIMVLTVVLLSTVDYSKAAVSGTSCTTDGNECDTIANAECDVVSGTEAGTCQCDDGYTEEGDSCVQNTVSTTDCSSDSAACDSISHSTCTAGKCQCDDGYKENVMECVKENGVGGLSANIGILCSMLIMLGLLMKW